MTSDNQTETTLKRGAPIGNRRVLESLPSKARTTSAQAAARSQLVKRLRYLLPAFAVILMIVLFVNTRNQPDAPVFLEEFEDIAAATEELKMANPRFTGVDDDGQPFEITAEYAIQKPNEQEVVTLEKPKAVQGNREEANTVTASKGVYRSEANILDLSEDVELEHEIGNEIYVLRSPKAQVLIADEVVTSEAGVSGKGPAGDTLQADRMTAYNADSRVVFEGNVSMRIYPKSAQQQDTLNLKDPALEKATQPDSEPL